ncbi:methyltransferase [Microtetraspora malaysiensis]|uniref:methyltransferase n=1 Tax=Microtetraspora malaysiensis TaxID=161358 RepID=UPI003D8CF74D
MPDDVSTAVRPHLDIASIRRLADLADYIVPFAIRAVCTLGVADHLGDGPLPVADLAQRCGAEPRALLRVLRALAGKGIFTEAEPGVFALTPLAQPLRSDHPVSLREAYPLLPGDLQAWAHFDYTLRTGRSSFEHVLGKGYWEYLAEHPEESKRFDGSQAAGTRMEVRTVISAYDSWSKLKTVVDLGGGNGMFLNGLLSRLRHLHGTLFDQPHVVDSAPAMLREAGLADRCDVVGGSFFDGVPEGADAYLLKRVLWSWQDEHAHRLLCRVREAMRPDSRLLVHEPVSFPGDTDEVGKVYDLILLTMGGGCARTEEELQALFDGAGLRISRVLPTPMFPLVEVFPAD